MSNVKRIGEQLRLLELANEDLLESNAYKRYARTAIALARLAVEAKSVIGFIPGPMSRSWMERFSAASLTQTGEEKGA